MILEETIQKIVERIVEVSDPSKIILFGSYADGTERDDSDLDILVIQETELSVYKRAVPIHMKLWGIKIPVDLIVWTPDEFQSRKDNPYSIGYQIERKGKTLYERN